MGLGGGKSMRMTEGMYQYLQIQQEEDVAVITLCRPKANALNRQMLLEIGEAFTRAAQDDGVKGVIVTAEGEKFFAAGAEISGFLSLDAMQARELSRVAQEAFGQIETLEKPVIAAINGYALGGGCELAMACDIRIASTKAVFGQPEVSLGIMPCFGGTQRLPRLVGMGIARELIYTGRHVEAEEAMRIGLVNRVVAPEALMPAAKEMMAQILSKAPLAISACKTAICRGLEMDLSQGLELERDLNGLLFSTKDKTEGVQAFLEKRQPRFCGK